MHSFHMLMVLSFFLFPISGERSLQAIVKGNEYYPERIQQKKVQTLLQLMLGNEEVMMDIGKQLNLQLKIKSTKSPFRHPIMKHHFLLKFG